MRKLTPLPLILFAIVSSSVAQEAVPIEEAREGARKANATIALEKENRLQIDADVEKPVAIRGGAVALMIVPDKRLNAGQLATLKGELLPVAQLWTRNASVQVNGESAKRDQVRVIGVDDGFKKAEVELYLIGAKKNESGASELLLFAKGKEPMLRLPIASGTDPASAQTLPIELTGRKTGDTSGVLTLRFAGGQSAEIAVG
ncbi:MAG TPA: hypothetical protein VFV83_06835, partial [Chthoniobacteraceae bacterium]|nr:hypothetical protein [Chthoniobacteraceae bacterium]